MQKKLLATLGLVATLFVTPLKAAEMGFGVGFVAGTPTGVTIKSWGNDDSAVDFAAEWVTSSNDSVYLHANQLYHDFDLIRVEAVAGRIGLYYGYGGMLKLNEGAKKETIVGLRIPLGVNLLLHSYPFEAFVEVAPTLNVVPDTDLNVYSAIGARFYF